MSVLPQRKAQDLRITCITAGRWDTSACPVMLLRIGPQRQLKAADEDPHNTRTVDPLLVRRKPLGDCPLLPPPTLLLVMVISPLTASLRWPLTSSASQTSGQEHKTISIRAVCHTEIGTSITKEQLEFSFPGA
jgi:hypothetical protein